MAKNLKLKIKNTQLKAAGLEKLKAKLAREPSTPEEKPKKKKIQEEKEPAEAKKKLPEEPRRIRAKSKSAFAPVEETYTEKKEELFVPSEEVEPVLEEPEIVEMQEAVEIEEEVISTEEPSKVRLGPTGKHVKDLLPPKKEEEVKAEVPVEEKPKKEIKEIKVEEPKEAEEEDKGKKGKKVKEFKDFKPKRPMRSFEPRGSEDDEKWRKKRHPKMQKAEYQEEQIVRPTELTIRLPISVKDLAQEMKLKASELIAKLIMQGLPLTLNDRLDDETIIQLLGEEFGCKITFDRAEAEKIRITDQTVKEEIAKTPEGQLQLRPPVVAFMGHVDHGKTSLIDRIRQTNLAATEAGAITQHIGAFRCKTAVGDITILDTPGHEAFSSMRARGAEVTDIVVLVVAGDEGLRDQTIEAIQHARAAKVTIVVALNKSDKPTFNADKVYQQLAEQNLLPEAWGGQIITVNTSAVTGQGIPELLEMLALQAEVLELRANPHARARGTVLESELHKGLGVVATVLVQNGSLKHGDAVVFARHFGRIKTMHDEFGKELEIAGPSSPVAITGLSGLPAAGDPFIVVANEKTAREIAEARVTGRKEEALLVKKRTGMELLQAGRGDKKVLKLLLRADVQGSVEALKASLLKIHSDKVDLDIIFTGVGEISESDIQLASASHAVIIGFHTQIESHAEMLIKELGVTVRLHNIIYHAIEEVQGLMLGMLEKIEEEKEVGKAEVQALFKASQLGVIAGCIVTEGVIQRNNVIRLERGGEMIWKGSIASLKRVKEDVREVKKGLECGILLEGFNAVQVGDIIHGYELTYRIQEL